MRGAQYMAAPYPETQSLYDIGTTVLTWTLQLSVHTHEECLPQVHAAKRLMRGLGLEAICCTATSSSYNQAKLQL